MAWLSDTNAVSVLLNKRNSALMLRVANCPFEELFLCAVVKGELIYGAWKCPDPAKALAKLAPFFRQVDSLPYNDSAAECYGRIDAYLGRNGSRIGPNDTMIAAIALANNLTLVTHNTREFARVPGLLIEDWQQ